MRMSVRVCVCVLSHFRYGDVILVRHFVSEERTSEKRCSVRASESAYTQTSLPVLYIYRIIYTICTYTCIIGRQTKANRRKHFILGFINELFSQLVIAGGGAGAGAGVFVPHSVLAVFLASLRHSILFPHVCIVPI